MGAVEHLFSGFRRLKIDRPLVNGGKIVRPPIVALVVILKDSILGNAQMGDFKNRGQRLLTTAQRAKIEFKVSPSIQFYYEPAEKSSVKCGVWSG